MGLRSLGGPGLNQLLSTQREESPFSLQRKVVGSIGRSTFALELCHRERDTFSLCCRYQKVLKIYQQGSHVMSPFVPRAALFLFPVTEAADQRMMAIQQHQIHPQDERGEVSWEEQRAEAWGHSRGRGRRSGWGRGQGTERHTRCKLMRWTFIPALDLSGSTSQTNHISNV